uniref:Uncharacterized protein n=1 Tax=Rhizophora mucronata TaxID=61149 RepID=A0A2P2QED5_RHIMU
MPFTLPLNVKGNGPEHTRTKCHSCKLVQLCRNSD